MTMTMENQEEILDALTSFEKKPCSQIPPVLEQYLRQIAKTGETFFPWHNLKTLFINKLDEVMKQFNQDFSAEHLPDSPNVENCKFEEMRSRILQTVDQFQGAPFTIQRLCELLTDPRRHYKRSDKFLRGIEKNVLVVSTVDPFGRKVVSETRNMVNGLNGFNGGQGDGQPTTQFSTFPTSPLTNTFTERSSAMKISEQCDEMPEAENEKILKDIMESEKSQIIEDGSNEDAQTQNSELSGAVEKTENSACESETEQENLKDTKNNTNSDIQNTDTGETEKIDSTTDVDSHVDDKTSEIESACDTTESLKVEDNVTTSTEMVNEVKEENTLDRSESEQYPESEEESEGNIENNSKCRDEKEDSKHLSTESDDISNTDKLQESVCLTNTGTDVETSTITSSEDNAISSDNQTQVLNIVTESDIRESDIVTECDNKPCDSSDSTSVSDDTKSHLTETDSVQSNVTSTAEEQDILFPTKGDNQGMVSSSVNDQSVNMDIDSSSVVVDQCKEDNKDIGNLGSLTKDENEVTDSSHEVPMEQD